MRPVRWLLVAAPLLVLVGLVALFAATIDRDPARVPSALLNRPVPEFSLPPVPGVSLAGFDGAGLRNSGQVSVVNVFASWCVPCRDEHPLLMALGQRDDILLYGLNHKDAPEQARAFLDELGNPFDAIGADGNGRVSIEWGVYGVPETFVVSPAGVITFKHVGPLSPRAVQEELLPAIARAAKT